MAFTAGMPVLDLITLRTGDFATLDMNVVMNDEGGFIESCRGPLSSRHSAAVNWTCYWRWPERGTATKRFDIQREALAR